MGRLYIKVGKPKSDGGYMGGQIPHAQIWRDGQSLGKMLPLKLFHKEIQIALKGKPEGFELECKDINDPAPEKMKLKTEEEQTNSVSEQNHQPEQLHPIDQNPYNFAEWFTTPQNKEPWLGQEPSKAKHNREQMQRYSGKIDVTLTAKTPIFIPGGDPVDGITTDFFSCWDGRNLCKAIPGSSLKGVVKSLFEALTNSRCGVNDKSLLDAELIRQNQPLYRRRASQMFKIITLPTTTTPGQVKLCKFVYLNHNHQIQMPNKSGWNQADIDNIRRAFNANQGEMSFDANLYWVPPSAHTHQKIKIMFEVTSTTFQLEYETLTKYLSMKGHKHFIKHSKNAVDAARNYYSRAVEYVNWENELFDNLMDKPFFMGITQNGKLTCFGRNVNFLWPGDKKTSDLVGAFKQRLQEDSKLEDSDTAELTFGFIGKDGQKNKHSHSYKGRVRFTPFWLQGFPQEMPEVQLMPLTSPSGTKLKSRPLYLKPSAIQNAEGELVAADYSDDDPQLRGRKFYWHQQPPAGQEIAHVHDFAQQQRGDTPETNMLPPKIKLLKADSPFTGEVHFTNLSQIELGALLASIAPHLLYQKNQEDEPKYGIKIGKGKPRGLGSVVAKVGLSVLKPAQERYYSLDSELFYSAAELEKKELMPSDLIQAYKQWTMTQEGVKTWDKLPFVRDLKALLGLPKSPSVRVYPPTFDMYNWMPEFNSPQGEHKGDKSKRSVAMKLARDL